MFASTRTPTGGAFADALRAFRTAMTVRLGEPEPAHRAPRLKDVRHLDDHLLKDIGYAREDRITAPSREVRDRLMARTYG